MRGARAGGDGRVARLLMAALDGELAREEREELERRLSADPALRREWEQLRRVKEVTEGMKLRSPPEEVWDGYWTGVYRRLERGVAWILVSLGAVVLVAYGLFRAAEDLIADPDLPGLVKAAVLALALGLIVLLVSVVREKLFLWKKEPYRDVQR